MKKKLFTLLTLLLCVCSGAWADGSFNFVKEGALNFTPGTAITSVTGLTITPSANIDESDNNKKWSINSTATFTYNTESITLGKTKYKTAPTITDGVPVSGSYVKLEAAVNGTVDVLYYINASGDKTFKVIKGTTANTIISEDSHQEAKIATFNVESGSTYYFYVSSNAGEYAAIYFTSTAGSPTITAEDKASIKATTSGVNATTDIDIEGSNLAGSTLTATLSPTVEGLSVGLASNTISEGAISTTATLTYNRTANVKQGSTTLTISDGTTSKEIEVTYSAKVVDWTLQSISKSTTWTFNDANITSGSLNQNISAIYANIDGMTFGNDFDATALELGKATWPYVSGGNIAQAKTFKFNTTVPGTVKVTYNKAGSDPVYISINGGENGSASSTTTTDAIVVSAGDVTIKGYTDAEHGTEQLLNVSKIEFTQTYAVAYATGLDHGSITGPTPAATGETVTVTTTPDSGYEFGALTITKTSDDSDVTSECSVSGNTFVMPAYAVKVSATFTEGPLVTMPEDTRTGYISSLASSTISGTGYTMNGQKAYNLGNGNSFTITIPAITTVSKIKVIGTSADNSNASTVTITGANSEHASATLNLRKAASVSEFEFVPTTQTTTYTISSANKGSYLQIAIYGTEATTQTITTNKGGWTSYTPVKNATLEEGATAYIVTAVDAEKVTASKVTTMKAGEGYFIKGATGNYTATFTDAAADATTGNKVVACLVATTINGSTPNTNSKFILGTNTETNEAGLFSVDSEITIPAGKAYLNAGGPLAARQLSLSFDDDETTGISAVENTKTEVKDNVYYNLNGQRVANPSKGLFIVNGKKVIIK